MSETAELVRVETPSAIATLSVDQVMNRLATIHELMAKAMTKDIDYGTIPGTGGKPTLLKPGAEKLCVLFQLDAQYETEKHFDGAHLTVETYCTIYNSNTGARLGGASAICSTKEKKYAYRKTERVCPECGKAAIIKGKAEYGGGWLCWKKKDGCNAKFSEGDPAIESQAAGQSDNPDLADCYNTVLRIAEKRAHVAAVRQVTGASAIFDEEAPHVEPDDKPKVHPSQQPPVERPSESRAKIADSLYRAVGVCEDEAAVDAALKMAPKGWFKVDDEHTRKVKEATEAKRLELRLAYIGQLCGVLGFDSMKLDLLAVSVGVKDSDNPNLDEALKIIKALQAERDVAGIV